MCRRPIVVIMTMRRPRSPLLVAPVLVPRPWGGSRLADLLDAHLAGRADRASVPGGERAREPIGEAWLVGPDSLVVGGPEAGARLDDVAARGGEAFVGSRPFARHGGRMPLLVKLLDAAEPLSVQVHPDDEGARRLAPDRHELGKTEAWLVLEAAPGSVVWWGFERPVDAEELRAAAVRGEVVPLLRRLEAAHGDVVVNEAGTVHAMGAGLLVYELQQASDLTFRLDDHGRLGPDGRPRQLHVEEAVAVPPLEPGERPAPAPEELGPGRTLLATTSAFTMERLTVGGPAPAETTIRVEDDTLEVWTVLDGAATLRGPEGSVVLGRYASAVLPAGLGAVALLGDATLIRGFA
jgi:mannose-6-phosphate isomerase